MRDLVDPPAPGKDAAAVLGRRALAYGEQPDYKHHEEHYKNDVDHGDTSLPQLEIVSLVFMSVT